MSSKADLKRAKTSLERERLRLRADALDLDSARRALSRERTAALAVLRRLTDRYGRSDYPDDLPLSTILEEYLAKPLAERSAPSAIAAPASRPARLEPPSVLRRPTPIPAPEHRCITVRSILRGVEGYRASCICGWRSPLDIGEVGATIAGSRHVDGERYRQARA